MFNTAMTFFAITQGIQIGLLIGLVIVKAMERGQ
jgi:hypothetical protein